MEALILSCKTGGGHNTAAQAVKEKLESHGHEVTFLDPYELRGEELANTVGNIYIRLVQHAPKLFGIVYFLGEIVRNIPWKSPVYWANIQIARRMQEFLEEHRFDVIIMTHVFPAEILTYLRDNHVPIPRMIFVATDYTCIPFTEETCCDYYVIPSPKLTAEFFRRGIPREKILPMGIPVRKEFLSGISRQEARVRLGMEENCRYILLAGGSVGAGKICAAVKTLQKYLRQRKELRLIVVSGNNEKLYHRLSSRYGNDSRIEIIPSTSEMAAYMRACDVVISKPGGLSSTEAAVLGTALIQFSPIPGCELHNADFFSRYGMSIAVKRPGKQLLRALEQLEDEELRQNMAKAQQQYVNQLAAAEICDLAESLTTPIQIHRLAESLV